MYKYNDICGLSLKIISMLNESGIKCTVLTKGLLPIELSNFRIGNEYGITLISLNEQFREKIEPNAAPYGERIRHIKELHEIGCKTWVSVEPYPTPNIIEQDIYDILESVKFVDKIIFGRTNYNAEISKYVNHKIFYNELSDKVIDFCEKNSIAYHIKDGTRTAIPKYAPVNENQMNLFAGI
jgi:DNA repair photolyase